MTSSTPGIPMSGDTTNFDFTEVLATYRNACVEWGALGGGAWLERLEAAERVLHEAWAARSAVASERETIHFDGPVPSPNDARLAFIGGVMFALCDDAVTEEHYRAAAQYAGVAPVASPSEEPTPEPFIAEYELAAISDLEWMLTDSLTTGERQVRLTNNTADVLVALIERLRGAPSLRRECNYCASPLGVDDDFGLHRACFNEIAVARSAPRAVTAGAPDDETDAAIERATRLLARRDARSAEIGAMDGMVSLSGNDLRRLLARLRAPGETPEAPQPIRWWNEAGFFGPFSPAPDGGNDGFVRDGQGAIVADCLGYEARANVIATLLTRAALPLTPHRRRTMAETESTTVAEDFPRQQEPLPNELCAECQQMRHYHGGADHAFVSISAPVSIRGSAAPRAATAETPDADVIEDVVGMIRSNMLPTRGQASKLRAIAARLRTPEAPHSCRCAVVAACSIMTHPDARVQAALATLSEEIARYDDETDSASRLVLVSSRPDGGQFSSVTQRAALPSDSSPTDVVVVDDPDPHAHVTDEPLHVRDCRGHFHLNVGGHDLMADGDPFPTRDLAEAALARELNTETKNDG